MHPMYFVALFWVLVLTALWLLRFVHFTRQRRRLEARRPRFVKIKVVVCSVCCRPIEQGELAVRGVGLHAEADLVVDGVHFSHVKCTPPDMLEKALDSTP